MRSCYHKIKLSAISCVMALLFAGGVLLGGSEFVGFPWGPLAGAVCFVALLLMCNRIRRYHGRM